LINFFFYITRDLDLSKDLVQEIFAKLWIARNNLDPEKSVKSYLFKSLTNQIINNSKLSSSKNISIDESILNNTTANNINIENQIDLHSAIEKLPEKSKTVFMLSRIEGFKYSEIAEICEISIKAVEKRMTKTLKILRKSLS
ncbi:MAG: sigma-70 family RNA polymerase sigma factor, partial [Ignavibacteriae bacterium]|nr:sigma-70 family RNA polymerase sigma factor [Ignavibacteriota bacterium]